LESTCTTWALSVTSSPHISIAYLESLEVVDEDVWQPKVIHKLDIDRHHGAGTVKFLKGNFHSANSRPGKNTELQEKKQTDYLLESVWDDESRLCPHHVEVAAELDTVLLVFDPQHVNNIDSDVDDVHLNIPFCLLSLGTWRPTSQNTSDDDSVES
jgi:hypothetical protein